jgi:hypothetical protein
MLLDRALRATIRNFSTLFLLVALVMVPLQVAHAYVFRRVIAVSELHPAIEGFPEGRKVARVGPGQLRKARTGYLVIGAIEILLLPLLVRAAARVMAVDRAGGVPTVVGAFAGMRGSLEVGRLRGLPVGPLVVAATLGITIGWLTRALGLVLVEPLADGAAFSGVGLIEGVARALGGAFVVGPAGWALLKDT